MIGWLFRLCFFLFSTIVHGSGQPEVPALIIFHCPTSGSQRANERANERNRAERSNKVTSAELSNKRTTGPVLTIHSCIESQWGEAGGVPSGLSKSFSNTVAFRNNKIELMSILNLLTSVYFMIMMKINEKTRE